MLSRLIGIMWVGIGVLCGGLSISWMVLEERLLNTIPTEIISSMGLIASLISAPLLAPPTYGAQVAFLVGAFLIVLGLRLAFGIAGTRIVAAFIHVVVGLCLLVLTFLLFTMPIPWPSPNIHYAVCAVVLVLACALFGSAVPLYRWLDDLAARSWTPFEQCPKCGRKLSAPKQCPVHDLKNRYPRLVDQARQKVYPIPSATKPVLIGRSSEASVWFDETLAKEYVGISRDHAHITYDQGRQSFWITTLPGSTGVLVAGQQANPGTPTLLAPDATVKLGGVPFIFEIKEWYQTEVDGRAEDVRYALD